MKTAYKTFTIKYEFILSFWGVETMKVEAINIEQAKEKVLNELSMAYGSQILNEVKILN